MKKYARSWICHFMVMGLFILLLSNCKKDDNTDNKVKTVTDIDGNVYHTVIIGTQEWMVENLKTTRYRNGDPIPEVTDDGVWKNLTTGAYCTYKSMNDSAQIYGKLYNFYALTDSRQIAPEGWHVPSVTEWEMLINYLGGEATAGGKMKEVGIVHWKAPNEGADNSSGFTALPGSWREFDGRFSMPLGVMGFWWSSTMKDNKLQWIFFMSNVFVSAQVGPNSIRYSLSTRCVKD